MISGFKDNPYLFAVCLLVGEGVCDFVGSLLFPNFFVPPLLVPALAAVLSARYIHSGPVTSAYVTKFIYTYTGIPLVLGLGLLWFRDDFTSTAVFTLIAYVAILSALGYFVFSKLQPYLLVKFAESETK